MLILIESKNLQVLDGHPLITYCKFHQSLSHGLLAILLTVTQTHTGSTDKNIAFWWWVIALSESVISWIKRVIKCLGSVIKVKQCCFILTTAASFPRAIKHDALFLFSNKSYLPRWSTHSQAHKLEQFIKAKLQTKQRFMKYFTNRAAAIG